MMVLSVMLTAVLYIDPASGQNPDKEPPPTKAPKESFLRRLFINRDSNAQNPSDKADPSDAKKTAMKETGEELFAYAEMLYKKEFYDLAGEKYLKYVTIFPTGPHLEESLYRNAECYLKQKMEEKAIAAHKELIAAFPEGDYTAPAAYRVAGLAYNKKDYESAATFFGIAAENAKQEPLKIGALFYQARCLVKLNKTAGAKTANDSIVAEFPASAFAPKAALWLGNQANTQKDFQEALAHFEFVLNYEMSEPRQRQVENELETLRRESQYRKALCQWKLGNTKAAEETLQSLIEPNIDDEWGKRAKKILPTISDQNKK